MIIMNDIYYKVGNRLYDQYFNDSSIEKKKTLVDKELKNYLAEKIAELGNQGFLNSPNKDEVSVGDLVEVLGDMIPCDRHSKTLDLLTHYVMNIAGEMQGKGIIWWSDKKESSVGNPIVKFDEDGYWDNLITHDDESCVTSFKFAYDVFLNHFMTKQKVKKKTIRLLEDKV